MLGFLQHYWGHVDLPPKKTDTRLGGRMVAGPIDGEKGV